MRAIFQKRVEKLKKETAGKDIDLVLLIDRENFIYFTGITEVECTGLLMPQKGDVEIACLWLAAPFIKKKIDHEKVDGYLFPQSNLGEKIAEMIGRMVGKHNPRIGVGKHFLDLNVFEALQKAFPAVEFVNVSEEIYRVRACKDDQEMKLIKKATEIVQIGMGEAINCIKPGINEVQVISEAEYAMRNAGSEGSPFRMQAVAGKRQLLPHPIATNQPIGDNQTIVIHLGASYQGYCSKMCRTVSLGEVKKPVKDLYETLLQAQQASIKALKPGVPVKDVYQEAYSIIWEAGYDKYFIDDIGHGIGIRQSEFYPVIGKTRSHVIEKGMVVDLIFPTIYHPEFGGPRVTDIIYVGDEGPEILTDYPRELIELKR